ILVRRIKNQIKNDVTWNKNPPDYSSVLKTYFSYIYDSSNSNCLVLLVRFLKLIKSIGNMEYSDILFKHFIKNNHSSLNKFEWNYLIDNGVV
ncbi:hypothetical protein ACI3PL_21440, partial [Lacticaseibacillus paracasei]